jgi:DNA-binding response OmpR family regulator
MQPRILIVDDSVTVRMDLQQALKLAGFATVLCDSVRTARAALLIGFFTLAILDVMLPDGDGIELLGELRSHKSTSHIPVILISSESTVRSRIRGLMTGASEYIGKPYDSGYIVKRARDLSRGFELARVSSADALSSAAKVMVVDDSPTFSVAMVNQLRQDGHDVIIASTGEEALELLKVQPVDCIILDVQMPGIGGLETCRRIKSSLTLQSIPVLMVTASESAAARSLAMAAGADDFVAKASELELLRVRLRIRHLLRVSSVPAPPPSSPGNDAPPPSARRRPAPQEHDVNPPAGRRASPSQRGSDPSLSRESRPELAPPGPLLDRIVTASGLSTLIGSVIIQRACGHAAIDPERLASEQVVPLLASIRRALSVFTTGVTLEARMEAIETLVRGAARRSAPGC